MFDVDGIKLEYNIRDLNSDTPVLVDGIGCQPASGAEILFFRQIKKLKRALNRLQKKYTLESDDFPKKDGEYLCQLTNGSICIGYYKTKIKQFQEMFGEKILHVSKWCYLPINVYPKPIHKISKRRKK